MSGEVVECGWRDCDVVVPLDEAWLFPLRTSPGGMPAVDDPFCSVDHASYEFSAVVDQYLDHLDPRGRP